MAAFLYGGKLSLIFSNVIMMWT